jgi:hypothetical protein
VFLTYFSSSQLLIMRKSRPKNHKRTGNEPVILNIVNKPINNIEIARIQRTCWNVGASHCRFKMLIMQSLVQSTRINEKLEENTRIMCVCACARAAIFTNGFLMR